MGLTEEVNVGTTGREGVSLPEDVPGLGTPIFVPASPEVIHAKVERFLSFVARAAGPFAAQRNDAIRARERVERGLPDPECEIDYAIAVADSCLFDEMRPGDFNKAHLIANFAWTDSAAPYQRFFMYYCSFPREVFEEIENRCGEQLAHLAIGFPRHILHVQDGTGALGMLTPEFAYWANGPRFKPPIGVCRQSLFASLLRCGVNPFEHCEVRNTKLKIREEKEPRHIRKYRKLVPVSLRARGDARRFSARTARHWGALLGAPEGCRGETALLFNSGTSANESVVEALADGSGGHQFTHPFWYFESGPSIQRLFAGRTTPDPARAEIAFLNLEPVTLHSGFAESPCIPPQQTIRDFGKKAQAHTSIRHVLVIDVTLDPGFSVAGLLGNRLPENLCVVKTASASKHQWGGRNYFFGAVTVLNDACGNEPLRDLIARKRPLLGGSLSDLHSLHFPRPGPAWLAEKRRRVAALNRSLAGVIPPESDWRFFPFGFFSFLLPSLAVQRALNEHLLALRQRADKAAFDRINWRIYRALGGTLIADDHDARFPGIENGSSFGLPVSRVLLESVDYTGRDEDLGRYAVRISPGFAADPALLQTYVGETFERMRKTTHDLLSVSPQNVRAYELSLILSMGRHK